MRYRNQIQRGNDSEIAAAMNQSEMVAETVGTTYGSKCETKASGWAANQFFFQNSSVLRYIEGKDESKGSTAVREGNVRDVVGVRGYTTALGSPLWHGIPSSDIGRTHRIRNVKSAGFKAMSCLP